MFKNIRNISIFYNEPLANHCTFKIGGAAKFYIEAKTIDALLDVIFYCRKHNIRFKLIGGGSNLLFDDKGFNGAIIKYVDCSFKILDQALQVSSGTELTSLNNVLPYSNLGGLEFCVGVPLTIGGAIINNFGAYNFQFSDIVQNVTVLRKEQITYLSNNDCQFSYHESTFQKKSDIILSSTLKLSRSTQEDGRNKSLQFFNKRKNSQPLNLPNAGSIFKRQENIIPAKLIDEAGLKGYFIGGAKISTKHAGFIVNMGNAKSIDVLSLINYIKNIIYNKFSLILETEIEIIPYNLK